MTLQVWFKGWPLVVECEGSIEIWVTEAGAITFSADKGPVNIRNDEKAVAAVKEEAGHEAK